MPSELFPNTPPERTSNRRQVLKAAALTAVGGVAGGVAVNAVAPAFLRSHPAFAANSSYWSKALPPPNAPLQSDLSADVVVIGGGFTGLSTAYYLRKLLPAKRVVLLEARACGNGASGRNGAMVLTMTESRYMRLSSSPSVDRQLYDLTANNIISMQSLAKDLRIDCELERNGALQVLTDPADIDGAKDLANRARDLGFPVEFWDRARTAATIGAKAYHGALFDPGAGQVHPGKLVGLFKAAAMGVGAEIYEATPVVDIQEGPIHQLLTAAGHKVRTPILVLATNAYSSKIGFLRNAVAPIFDYVAITPVLSEAQLRAAGWASRIPFNDNRTETYYAGLTQDCRIHIGGGPVDYVFNDGVGDPPDVTGRYKNLHQKFTSLFPGLADVAFEQAWAGSVDMSLDGSPVVGQMGRSGNIFYGIGFSGHGVNLTSIFGRIIADLIAGYRSEWTWLPLLDRKPPYIPNEPFRWLGIQGDLAATRLTESST